MSADLSVTMQFDPEEGIADLETYLDHLKREADAAGFDPVARCRALAIELELSRPRPARDNIEAHVRKMSLEPAVQADSVVILVDFEGARVGHGAPISRS